MENHSKDLGLLALGVRTLKDCIREVYGHLKGVYGHGCVALWVCSRILMIEGECATAHKECVAAQGCAAVHRSFGLSQQKPVYFVSRKLQGPELKYPTLEKLVLALIYAARRLRRYFQAYQIEVLTNCPIKQILLKPETSGRLAKWVIELGEHDISYRPRMSIKGKTLADFLLEIPGEGDVAKDGIMAVKEIPKESQKSTLYTDGASSREGSRACLILTSPEGEEVTYALRFDFHTSNNEAEYEALLPSLRLAKQMGVEAVAALTDSRLAANQVNGSFETRDKRMERYVKTVRQLTKSFKEFTIKQIPRSENRRADALTKLASTCFNHLSKKVLVEVLKEKSILPSSHDEAIRIRIKAPSYALINGELYWKGFTTPWLRCVDEAKGKEALREAHAGQADAHEGARALTGKVLRMGIYWPTRH
uniref:RNase H type-1 domain-containing protein n=1 Tax=Lactuca sativa TaxID=4236 RepID=A0A9R1XEI6_LACSA|nr:hypothetical protein LSAT_V11C400159220 [Lactuca sativa]